MKVEMEAEMKVDLETFHYNPIISKKPILANRLFLLFAELLQITLAQQILELAASTTPRPIFMFF